MLFSYEQFDDPNTLNNYLLGGEIVKNIIGSMINNLQLVKTTGELINYGEKIGQDHLNKIKSINNKGFCFPICVSKNEVAGNDTRDQPLSNGDLIKIELGIQINGFPSCCCTSVLLTNELELSSNDPRLRVMSALNEAKHDALKILNTKYSNIDLVDLLQKIAVKHNCNLLLADSQYPVSSGVISYQMSQNVIDGKNDDESDIHKLIIGRINDTYDFELSKTEFEENEVYAIDIAFSSGSGKINPIDPVVIYGKNNDTFYSLRLKSSKESLNYFNNYFPINCRQKMVDNKFKLGLVECIRNNLIKPYYAMSEKNGEYIARSKFTVIIRKNNKNNKKGHIIVADIQN
jgi:methionine aminopeptidase